MSLFLLFFVLKYVMFNRILLILHNFLKEVFLKFSTKTNLFFKKGSQKIGVLIKKALFFSIVTLTIILITECDFELKIIIKYIFLCVLNI